MTRFIPTHTRSAVEVLVTERDRIAAERDAFAAFHDYLNGLEVPEATSRSLDPQHRAGLAVAAPAETHLQRVRSAYRETVMSVDHYEEDYDELLGANLAAEFSPEVARAVMTSGSLSAPLYERLLAESQRARDQRTLVLTDLTDEFERLQTADTSMSELGSNLRGLTASSLHAWTTKQLAETRKELLASEHRCNDLAADRQVTLRTTRLPGPRRGEIALEEYVYRSLSVDYPVLADLAELSDLLRTVRGRIEQARTARERDRLRTDTKTGTNGSGDAVPRC